MPSTRPITALDEQRVLHALHDTKDYVLEVTAIEARMPWQPSRTRRVIDTITAAGLAKRIPYGWNSHFRRDITDIELTDAGRRALEGRAKPGPRARNHSFSTPT